MVNKCGKVYTDTHNQHFLHMGLLSQDNKSHVSPEKTKQDQHHKKLEPAQGIKENEYKQWKEVKEHNLL